MLGRLGGCFSRGVGVRLGVVVAIGVMVVVGFALAWANLPASRVPPTLAVPTFTAPTGQAGPAQDVAPRATLLPTDCVDVLTGPVDASALLGQPTGSVGVRTVWGVPAPSVGMLERVSCGYQRAGQGAPAMQLGLAAFTDQPSAAAQRVRNVAAERGDTRADVPVALGDAKADLLTQPTRSLLMVDYDRYTVTASLAHGVVPDDQVAPVLVDLVRRVLPTLTPPAAPGPAPAAVKAPGPARVPDPAPGKH
jgi:hypothetical protein